MVSKIKATRPSAMMSRVSGRTNLSAVICPATVRPSSRVIRFAKMGLAEDSQNFLLMYSISVNVSGQIASVLAGGLILSLMA